jgi:hypothetical protein
VALFLARITTVRGNPIFSVPRAITEEKTEEVLFFASPQPTLPALFSTISND